MNFNDYILSQTRPFGNSVGVDTPDGGLGSGGTANPAPAPSGSPSNPGSNKTKDGIRSVLMALGKNRRTPMPELPDFQPAEEYAPTSQSFLARLFGGSLY